MPTRDSEALSCGFCMSALVGLQRERETWFVMSQTVELKNHGLGLLVHGLDSQSLA